MDFASPERALTSLQRRNPPLPQSIKSVSSSLLDLYLKKDWSSNGSKGNLSDNRGDQERSSIFTLLGMDINSDHDDLMPGKDVRWEPLAVGMLLVSHWLERHIRVLLQTSGQTVDDSVQSAVYADGPRQPCLIASTEGAENKDAIVDGKENAEHCNVNFCRRIVIICQQHLEHDEPRVRTLIARVIGAHAKYAGLLTPQIIDEGENVRSQLIAQRDEISRFIGTSLRAHAAMYDEDRILPSPDFQAPALDDTTGWRALETSLIALASWINGCGVCG